MSETNLPFNEKICPNNAQVSSGKKFRQEWEKSIKNPQEFWAEKAKAIDWFKTWDKVLDDSDRPFYKWFAGGILNISYNALDRHVKTQKKKISLHTSGKANSARSKLTLTISFTEK